MDRNLGCGGLIATAILFLGVPAVVYGLINWVIHYYSSNQL